MDEPWINELEDLDSSGDVRELIKPDLEPGERLLWASRPGLRVRKKSQCFPLAAVIWAAGMLLLCVVCVAGVTFAVNSRFEGFSAALVIIGLIAGVVSFLIVLGTIADVFSGESDGSRLADQVYAITDRRAIVRITTPKTEAVTIQSYHRGTIKGELLHRVQYPDGSGDVVFQEAYKTAGFKDVADVRRVEGLIRRFLIVSESPSTA